MITVKFITDCGHHKKGVVETVADNAGRQYISAGFAQEEHPAKEPQPKKAKQKDGPKAESKPEAQESQGKG